MHIRCLAQFSASKNKYFLKKKPTNTVSAIQWHIYNVCFQNFCYLYIRHPLTYNILVPSKPGDIRFWNVTYASLDVEWDPPTTPNGRIINYELSYIEENPTSTFGKYKI